SCRTGAACSSAPGRTGRLAGSRLVGRVSMEGLVLLVPVCVGGVFLLVFGLIAVQLARGFARWSRNNASPIETVPARVVTKRTETDGRMNGGAVWTTYYVTFETDDGGRQEYEVEGREFGVLVPNT